MSHVNTQFNFCNLSNNIVNILTFPQTDLRCPFVVSEWQDDLPKIIYLYPSYEFPEQEIL